MSADQHLAWLVSLIAPPYTNGWWSYAKARAAELAMEDGEFASLPVLLHAEHERIAAEAKASRPARSTASNSKPTEPLAIVPRETTPAATPTTARKASTGRRVSSSWEGG